jgi:hypothetical protein
MPDRSFGIVYPLWSHADGGGDLLARAIGEVGIDHITVPVVTGPRVAYRAYATEPPKVFTTEGGWHYPPNTRAYAGVRPKSAGWFGKRDLLARVCETAAKRGLKVYFRIDIRHIPALLDRNPHLRGRNCFGDEMTYAGACLCNPQLRELLRNTMTDLARYEMAGFQLMEMSLSRPDRWQRDQMSITVNSSVLCNVCFCAACDQVVTGAGVEPNAAARAAQDAIPRIPTPEARKRPRVAALPETLDEYQQARLLDLNLWLTRLAAELGQTTGYIVGDMWDRPVDHFRQLVRAIPLVTDREILFERWDRHGPPQGLAHGAWLPVVSSADELVRFVYETQQRGVSFFDFEDLDESPPEAIDWLRQAVRYARRD